VLLIVGCGDPLPLRIDAGIGLGATGRDASIGLDAAARDASVETFPDAGPCPHGSATMPTTLLGRELSPFQRASVMSVFAGDPWPAILVETGPIARCACDPPPAGGPGNTLITFITDWPLVPGVRETIGVYVHADSSTSPVQGTGTLTLDSVIADGEVTGSMTIEFADEPAPATITFEAIDCNTVQ
jgi:hypothetical protein